MTREKILEDALKAVLKARQISWAKHIAKEALSKIPDKPS